MPKPKYKHMSPYECFLWDKFLEIHANKYRSFEYDVRVGEGTQYPNIVQENFANAAKILSQKRIDAVGFKPNGVHIFEVKSNAALSALGQLIGYQNLYARDIAPEAEIHLAVVSDHISDDDRNLFDNYGIQMFTFPDAPEEFKSKGGPL